MVLNRTVSCFIVTKRLIFYHEIDLNHWKRIIIWDNISMVGERRFSSARQCAATLFQNVLLHLNMDWRNGAVFPARKLIVVIMVTILQARILAV